MKVEVKINAELKEPILLIETPDITAEVEKILAFAEKLPDDYIVGFFEERAEILKFENIIRIATQDKKVFAITISGVYVIKSPLYEIEIKLPNNFLRISNGEIINVDYLQSIDMKFSGTLCLTLTNLDICYCSRRYVKKIKEYFEI